MADRISKGKACLTNLMLNLEKKGYVRREEDSLDRRNKRVLLTPAGEALEKQIHPIIYEVYEQMEEKFGVENIEANCLDLRRIYEIFEEL